MTVNSCYTKTKTTEKSPLSGQYARYIYTKSCCNQLTHQADLFYVHQLRDPHHNLRNNIEVRIIDLSEMCMYNFICSLS